MTHSVLLDTSFIIRLLNSEDPLHSYAKDYFRHFLENDIILKFSTISIAEYCVRGSIAELPLKNLHILPFNIDHAERAGLFAKILFENRDIIVGEIKPRAIIPNDSKLFAQADTDKTVTYYITSDARSKSLYNILNEKEKLRFQLIDLHSPYNETFGILDLK